MPHPKIHFVSCIAIQKVDEEFEVCVTNSNVRAYRRKIRGSTELNLFLAYMDEKGRLHAHVILSEVIRVKKFI